jgi:hypothetical protein
VSPRLCKRQNAIWLRFDHSTAQNVNLTPKILELPSYHLKLGIPSRSLLNDAMAAMIGALQSRLHVP